MKTWLHVTAVLINLHLILSCYKFSIEIQHDVMFEIDKS